jgi:hypothetical protein
LTETEDSESDDEKVDIGFRLTSKLSDITPWSKDDINDLLELHGTCPYVIGIYMLLVTLFFPVGGINLIFNFQNLESQIYSPIYMISSSFKVEIASKIILTIPLCILNYLFVIQINRFFSNTASRDIVLMVGILSIIAPTVITFYLFITFEFPYVITPIPIQFCVGVIFIYKFRDPDYVSPWKGYFLDLSWWIRRRHSMHDTESKVINLTNLLMKHDADWLEGWLDEDVEL